MNEMEMEKKESGNSSNSCEAPKQKERHIVSWSQEEDDLLREQIHIHGTENWTTIASKFKDKSTRQCRRRWYTYLNSDFKKGGWSPEEDMLLCEAQKIFGNRWTEIAKVVPGRTDNAVKNRFSTLCKKRAKENNTSGINLNNKGTIFQNGLYSDSTPEPPTPYGKIRKMHISEKTENCSIGIRFLREHGTVNLQLRPPLAELVQNFQNVDDTKTLHHVNTRDAENEDPKAASNKKKQGTFLKKGDPKIFALIKQAELLSSLALKVNSDNTDESRENAWKVVKDFLKQTKESDASRSNGMNFQLENFVDLVKDLRSISEGNQISSREPDLHGESPGGSYSTGSTLLSNSAGDKPKRSQAEISVKHQDLVAKFQSTHERDQYGSGERDATTNQDILTSCDDTKTNDGAACASTTAEFSSPLQLTPLFRSLAEGIPTPKFSESERHFLLKTLGMESSSPRSSTNPSKPPPCKRILLHNL